MIKSFLQIRLKQLIRISTGLGWPRMLLLLGLVTFLIYFLSEISATNNNAFKITGGLLANFIVIQMFRKDMRFLKTNLPNYKQIITVEYSVFSVPVLAILLYNQQCLPALLILVGNVIIPYLHYTPKSTSLLTNTIFTKLIPADCFEWKAGSRTAIYLILPIWLIGLGASYSTPAVVPIVIYVLTFFLLPLNAVCEPYQTIIAHEKSSKEFILHKIYRQVFMYAILITPLMIAFIIFHPQWWFVPVAEFVVFSILMIYLLLIKYAFYQSNSAPASAPVYILLGSLGLYFPIVMPIIWVLTIRFYFKSVNNLNYYLDDFN